MKQDQLLQLASAVNGVVFPWEVLVGTQAVMVSVCILLARRAWCVREYISLTACVLLVIGLVMRAPYATLTQEPFRAGMTLTYMSAMVFLYLTHRVLRTEEKEQERDCRG